jgi:hypothetical protein
MMEKQAAGLVGWANGAHRPPSLRRRPGWEKPSHHAPVPSHCDHAGHSGCAGLAAAVLVAAFTGRGRRRPDGSAITAARAALPGALLAVACG